ncbi:hypothetical protein GW17_00005392, partial [Ensete ventricosum]
VIWLVDWWAGVKVNFLKVLNFVIISSSVHLFICKVCNFDLYRPVRAVHTGPPGYRYADRSLPDGFVKNRPSTVDFGRRRPIKEEIDHRQSIEEEKGKKKRKRKKKKEGKKEYLARLSSPPASRLRAVVACSRSFSRARRRSVSPRGETDRGDVQLFADSKTYALMEHALVVVIVDYFVIYFDKLVLLSQRSGCLGSTLAVMKKSSKFLPVSIQVIGWSMWFTEYLFLERSWAKDESTLKVIFTCILLYSAETS